VLGRDEEHLAALHVCARDGKLAQALPTVSHRKAMVAAARTSRSEDRSR
jgi:hypothetical protein